MKMTLFIIQFLVTAFNVNAQPITERFIVKDRIAVLEKKVNVEITISDDFYAENIYRNETVPLTDTRNRIVNRFRNIEVDSTDYSNSTNASDSLTAFLNTANRITLIPPKQELSIFSNRNTKPTLSSYLSIKYKPSKFEMLRNNENITNISSLLIIGGGRHVIPKKRQMLYTFAGYIIPAFTIMLASDIYGNRDNITPQQRQTKGFIIGGAIAVGGAFYINNVVQVFRFNRNKNSSKIFKANNSNY